MNHTDWIPIDSVMGPLYTLKVLGEAKLSVPVWLFEKDTISKTDLMLILFEQGSRLSDDNIADAFYSSKRLFDKHNIT